MNRPAPVVVGVTLLHVGALWALQHGVLQHIPAEVIVPAALLMAEVPTPPAPQPQAQVAQPRQAVAPPLRKPAAKPLPQPVTSAPAPSVAAELAPAPVDAAAAPAVAAAPVAPPAPPAPPRVELPSSRADYLQNPPIAYPPMSKRLGETGQVIVRVLIGADGQPQRAELKRSSGFDRLDRAALDYVLKCRYVPGKVGGVAQAMWHDAPVNFILE